MTTALIEKGQAKVYEGNKRVFKYEGEFRIAEAGAKSDQIGIWASPRSVEITPEHKTANRARKPRKPPAAEFPWAAVLITSGVVLLLAGWRVGR